MKELITAGLLFMSSPVQAADNNIVWNDNEHVKCLALNMYHEARDQGTAGKLAVSAVVINRVSDSRFPNTICEVIKQGPTRKSWRDPSVSYPIKNRCQFAWYCDGISDDVKDENRATRGGAVPYLLFSELILFYIVATRSDNRSPVGTS